jgi:polyketide synthase PksN
MQAERSLRFGDADVALFAAASGDLNPLHTDREFAAGTAFGSPIVHGALLAIAMLGTIPGEALSRIRSLQISFAGAMPTETMASVTARTVERRPGAWETRLTARGRIVARVLADSNAFTASPAKPAARSDRVAPGGMRAAPAEPTEGELRAGRVVRGRYAAGPALEALAGRFSAVALDRRLLEGLAWTSYVVGMELPGLHSLFAGATLGVFESEAADGGVQTLVVRDHDERTGQLTIDGTLATRIGGGAHATIQCFALPRAGSPDTALLGLDRTPAPERGAVVVAGGSRGFGASLALALLAIGYQVHVAYATSKARAAELARLAGAHEPRLRLTRIDVGDPEGAEALAASVSAAASPLVGLVLNAAPPPLAMSLTAQSSTELADYVAASLRLVAVPLAALLPLVDEHCGWVLFCSSEAIAAPPRDWPHYVAAKAAVEGLARWVAATKPSLRTVVVRPPKMQTAMTATPSGRIGASSADAVARWTAERVTARELKRGLTMLEPGGEVAPA